MNRSGPFPRALLLIVAGAAVCTGLAGVLGAAATPVGPALASLSWGAAPVMTRRAKIPLQPVRGWWTMRLHLDDTDRDIKLRLTLPEELPLPVHFHILAFPELTALMMTGGAPDWPKGAFWAPGGTALAPIPLTEIVRTAGTPAAPIPWRVGPTMLSFGAGPPPQHAVWGAASLSLTLAWKEVRGHFPYHGALTHAAIGELPPGSRTAWLDVSPWVREARNLAGVRSLLVALAPYAQGPSGEDLALCQYAPTDAGPGLTPVHPRRQGDYPNDPTLLWRHWHADLPTPWSYLAYAGWTEGAGKGGDALAPLKFSMAWMASAMGFTHWTGGGGGSAGPIDIGLRRPPAWLLERNFYNSPGVQGLAQHASRWKEALLNPYLRSFKPVGSAQFGSLDALYDEVPIMRTPAIQAWLAPWLPHIDPLRFMEWYRLQRAQQPNFPARLTVWLTRGPIVSAEAGGGISPSQFVGMAMAEAISGVLLNWDDADPFAWAYDFVSKMLSDAAFRNAFDQLINQWTHICKVLGEVSQEDILEERLDQPLRAVPWAFMLPPFFGQLGVLGSAEPTNLLFHWWKGAAEGLHRFTVGDAPSGLGLDPAQYPWAGWFPAGEDPSDAVWLARMHQAPWTVPLAPPRQPDWTREGHSPNDPHLSWQAILEQADFWPPLPPSTRAHARTEEWPALVLPTAAYLLGPVEILIGP